MKPHHIGATLEGQQLGHFQLDEFVGGGGMGAVFRGVDKTLGRTVAVKVVSNENTEADTLKRFQNEAQSAARLDHPNIARVYFVGEDRGWNYIVFEFIEGVNIRDLVNHRGPLPIDEAVSYTIQVADALEHASQRDVVHRDIKPSNVLVMEDGKAKLVDMGLARLHQVDAPSNDLTATGVTLGTFDYISPEQARDPREADVRSDLYSLGCTLYYMLTGLPPFPDGTVLQKLLSHSSEPPPSPLDLRADLPDELARITLKLMAKLPTARYQTPGQLMVDLLNACERLGLTTARPAQVSLAPRTSSRRILRRHAPWVTAVLATVLGVVGIDAMWADPAPLSHADLTPVVLPRQEHSEPDGAAVSTPPTENVSPDEQVEPSSPVTDASSSGGDSGQNSREPGGEQPMAADPATDSTPPSAVDAASGPLVSENTEVDEVASAPSVTRIVVFPDSPPSPPSDALVVTTLEEAIERVAEQAQVDTIELKFDEIESDPVTLNLERPLKIIASPGFQAAINFRPPSEQFGQTGVLTVLNERLSMQGVRLRMHVPYSPVDGWSLFDLNRVPAISLNDCVLTVLNDYGTGATFFMIRGPDGDELAIPDGETSEAVYPSISLVSCIARGQATLVRATEGSPFQLSWTEGFLATSQTMADIGPVSDMAAGSGVARIILNQVTALVDGGLCRLSSHGMDSMTELDIQAEYCLIVHRRTRPLVEHIGADDAEKLKRMFWHFGERNIYPQTEVYWSIAAENGDTTAQYSWAEREDLPGYEERSVVQYAPWRAERFVAPHPVYTADPSNYLLSEDQPLPIGFTRLPSLDQGNSNEMPTNTETPGE